MCIACLGDVSGKSQSFFFWGKNPMISVPALKTVCGEGHGMAACPVLRLLVTSSYNDLTVFALPDSLVEKAGTSDGSTRIRTIGGGGSAESMDFKFMEDNGCISGWMAFTGSTAASRLLLVTDAGNNAVHVIDVLHGAHVGYLAAPGSIGRALAVGQLCGQSQVAAARRRHTCPPGRGCQNKGPDPFRTARNPTAHQANHRVRRVSLACVRGFAGLSAVPEYSGVVSGMGQWRASALPENGSLPGLAATPWRAKLHVPGAQARVGSTVPAPAHSCPTGRRTQTRYLCTAL
jgi:hypothetical protein